MKKFIVPMLLGCCLLTGAGLTSCSNVPAETAVHQVNVRRANNTASSLNQHKVNSFVEGEVENILVSTPEELGLPTTKFIPKTYNDFKGQSEFEYTGFKYKVTESNGEVTITRDLIGGDYKTATEIYAGEIEGADTFSSTYNAFNSFTAAKIIYGAKSYGISMVGLTELETLVVDNQSRFEFDDTVATTLKNIVFTSVPTEIVGLEKCHDNIRFVAPASIAIEIRTLLDKAYDSNSGNLTERPTLYTIPDDRTPLKLKVTNPSYEYGGLYFSNNGGRYQVSNVGQYVTKAVFDTTELEANGISLTFTDYSEMLHVDELYYIQPTSSSYNFLAYLDIDKVYLKDVQTQYAIRYFETCDEVYFPVTETVITTISCNATPENTTFYVPEGYETQYAKLIENTYLSNNIEYYDASSYTPSIEVNYDGKVVSSKDLSTSYRSLLKEAMEEDKKDDTLSPEEQEKLEEDKEAAFPVQDSISNLTNITLESKDAILEAKEAFEALTYDQQQLVENVEDLEKAIEDYNELVKDYNKDIEDEEQYLELIEELHIKNKVEGFIEDIKDNKAMTAVTVLAGTAFGGLLLYGIYKFISKFFKWLKR